MPHIVEGYLDLQQMSNMYIKDMKAWIFSLSDGMGELSGYASKFSEYFIDIETLWLYYILWIAM